MKRSNASPFDSLNRELPKGFTPEEIEKQKQEFAARGGKIHVVPCGPRPEHDPKDYASRRRKAQIRLRGSFDRNGNPPEAA